MTTSEPLPVIATDIHDNVLITLQHDDGTTTFRARPGQNLLDAALDSGVAWPHGCRTGECGVCKCEQLSGEVLSGWSDPMALPNRERMQGRLLACTAIIGGEAALRVNRLDSVAPQANKLRVVRCERRTLDVVLLHLLPISSESLQFQAGQYLHLTLPNGSVRAYSIASEPGISELEFHIRRQPQGIASRYAYDALTEGDFVGFSGPYGEAVLQTDDSRPMLAICGGTGYAPLRAIVRNALAYNPARPIHLCWFVRDESDAYDELSLHELEANNSSFTFTICSGLDAEAQVGVMQNLLTWHDGPVHAAGASRLVGAALSAFLTAGLPETDFYADPFG